MSTATTVDQKAAAYLASGSMEVKFTGSMEPFFDPGFDNERAKGPIDGKVIQTFMLLFKQT